MNKIIEKQIYLTLKKNQKILKKFFVSTELKIIYFDSKPIA